MDIPALSTAMASSQIQAQASLQVAVKVMDIAKQDGANLVNLMQSAAVENSVTPHLGGNVDVKL